MKAFVTLDGDEHLLIRGLSLVDHPHLIPLLKTIGTLTYRAHRDDELYLRSVIDADWPEIPRPLMMGPDKYLDVTPRGYQFATRGFGKRLLLADDPGLGKTIEALMFLYDRNLSGIIICRATSKSQWTSFATLMGMKPQVPTRRREMEKVKPPTLLTPLIVHYEQMGFLTPEFVEALIKERQGRVGVVLDECHAVKSPAAGRTGKAYELFHQVPYKVLISATPIRNRMAELWSQLTILDQERFGNWLTFAMRYCDGKYKTQGKQQFLDASGTSNWDELMLRLQPIMLRRSYDNVHMELPPLTRSLLPLIVKSSTFEREENDFRQAIKEWTRTLRAQGSTALFRHEILAFITRYKHAAAVEKLPMVKEWLSGRGQVLVLTSFATVAKALYKELPESLILTGETPPTLRAAILEQFRESELPLIATIATGGEGLNLQSAHEVAFIDLPWTPSEILQAEQRVWRQGQTDPVLATYFVGQGTIEERIIRTLLTKEQKNPLGGSHRDSFEAMLNLVTSED